MMKQVWRKGALALAVSTALCLSTGMAHAAGETTGGIVGSVEVTGGSSEGYTVTINNPETGFKRELMTSADGSFRFPQLPIGEYEVQVQKNGVDYARQTVRVTLGGQATTRFDINARGGAEVIEVVAGRPSGIDLYTTDSGLVLGESEFDKLPVGRGVTALALLAPGTVKGDGSFTRGENLASFGGSSVAENAYFINGLNVTNFRNGLGGSTVPFEFYEEFQIKTGGYSAEFGRALGGVVNAVVKSGTNEFEFGANAYYSPDAFRSDAPSVTARDGSIYIDNSRDAVTSREINIWAGGPIVQDTLFFYALYNPREQTNDRTTLSATDYSKDLSDDAFWGLNVTWQISDNHRVDILRFRDTDERKTDSYDYDYPTRTVGNFTGYALSKSGGDNTSVKYTGYFGDVLTVSALIGKNEYDLTDQSSNDLLCPFIVDVRAGVPSSERLNGCYVGSGFTSKGGDEREQKRLDFEWMASESHTLRFGYDSEVLTSNNQRSYSGNTYWRYATLANTATTADGSYTNNTGATQQLVRSRVLEGSGQFETVNSAYYLEDVWDVSDTLHVSLGLRNDMFENKDKNGDTFVKVDDQWAPRLGMTWDLVGDGNSKLFANFGQYYLPVANNTNVRLAGGERDIGNWYTYADIDPVTSAPIGAVLVAGPVVFSDGIVQDPRNLRDRDLKAMHMDEYIVGYQWELSKEYVATVRAVSRVTGNAIDDYCGPEAPDCALFNPGEDLTLFQDGEWVTYRAEDLKIDKSKREYQALQFDLNHRSENLAWTFSYTNARNYGNFEGYVKSDNGQTDAGITTDFDFWQLTDGAEGYLPNDRRHVLKFYGAYTLDEDFSIGWNALLQSGRPISAFGTGYPGDDDPQYGNTYYVSYCADADPDTGQCLETGYNRIPRGKAGRTPWIFSLDLNARYQVALEKAELTFYADVFNVFNAGGVTEVDEYAENAELSPSDTYGLAQRFQEPRSVRFGAELRF